MMATPEKAMFVKNTVRYASAFACLYAAVPTANTSCVKPATPSKDPVVKPARKSATVDAGRPAAITAGGTCAGISRASRFESTTLYTDAAMLLMRKRMLPAMPLALPRCAWSGAHSVTIVMAVPSVHPMKKTPKDTSTVARTGVSAPQLAMAPKHAPPRTMLTTHCHLSDTHDASHAE
ncbi:hypothetical protein HYQ46_003680 [Verticillium longisporum]|nr:hypothetical protein HYQ46_003680 [Verticillium longisporum]